MVSMTDLSFEHLCSTLSTKAWLTGSLHFIADVGGTNARLGFGRECPERGVVIIYTKFKMTDKSIDQLKYFFSLFIEKISPQILKRIVSGAVSVPGPVTNNMIGGPFNNLSGVARLAEYPTSLFPPGRSALLNDLEAGGYGILAISDAKIFSEYFKVMWEGSQWKQQEKQPIGTILGQGRCLVIAPGTGVGTSLINYNGVRHTYDVVPLEFSSTTVPSHTRDDAYLRDLAKYIGIPNYEPSVEAMSNGKAYEFNYYRLTNEQKTTPEIIQLAQKNDPAAMEAMTLTIENLLKACSESTMLFLPLTCVLIGDNMVTNSFFFNDAERLHKLREEFHKHPMQKRLNFLERTTFLRQIKSINMNLLGCFGFGTHMKRETTSSFAAKL